VPSTSRRPVRVPIPATSTTVRFLEGFAQRAFSFLRRIWRSASKPQVPPPAANETVLKGIANSADQPSSSTEASAYQIPFQSRRKARLFSINASLRVPAGLIWKKKALRWSLKVSRLRLIRSSEVMSESWTICLAISASGSLSYMRMPR
jgi:hypothetical protein